MTEVRERDALALDALADEVRRHHKAVEHHARSMLDEAIAAGEALLEAKGRLPHGEFKPWVAYCGVSYSSAAVYMRLAPNKCSAALLEASSIREALEALGGRRRRRPEPPPDFGKPGASLADDERWQRAALDAALRTGRWDAYPYHRHGGWGRRWEEEEAEELGLIEAWAGRPEGIRQCVLMRGGWELGNRQIPPWEAP